MKGRVLLIFAGALLAPLRVQGAETLTFSKDIAPIVFQRCATCHQPGGVAPFSLLTYADVKGRARLIATVVRSRQMPPWKPVGGHVEYANERRLTDAEIELFGEWVEAGKPQGDPAKLPPMPDYPDGWALGEPDLVLTMEEGYEVPADGPDVYRSFVFPLDLPEDKWVKAVELRLKTDTADFLVGGVALNVGHRWKRAELQIAVIVGIGKDERTKIASLFRYVGIWLARPRSKRATTAKTAVASNRRRVAG